MQLIWYRIPIPVDSASESCFIRWSRYPCISFQKSVFRRGCIKKKNSEFNYERSSESIAEKRSYLFVHGIKISHLTHNFRIISRARLKSSTYIKV